MFRRHAPPPEFRGFEPDAVLDRPSNVKALGLVCALLAVAIFGLLLVPAETPEPVVPQSLSAAPLEAPAAERVQSGLATPTAGDPIAQVAAEMAPVTRAETTLIGAPMQQLEMSASRLLRRPIRVYRSSAPVPDIRTATQAAMASFGMEAPKVERILVQALVSGQSDAFIDALLNAEVARGAVPVPAGLRTDTGGIDTRQLLEAVLEEAGL